MKGLGKSYGQWRICNCNSLNPCWVKVSSNSNMRKRKYRLSLWIKKIFEYQIMIGIVDSNAVLSAKARNQFLHQLFSSRCQWAHSGADARLRLARNFKFFTDVNFGTDETSLSRDNQWRPQQVGALTYFDVAHIEDNWSKNPYSKFMLTARDAAGNFRRRF